MSKAARPGPMRDKWRIRWLDHTGKRCSATFDRYQDAERELRRLQVESDEVRAGKRRPPPEEHAFLDLAEYWKVHRVAQKRSRKDDLSILARHLVPAFGKLVLRDLGPAEVDSYKLSKASLSAKTVHNHLTLLGTMLRLAIDLGWLHSLPPIRKPKVDPDEETDPPWLKTQGEIDRFLSAARRLVVPRDPHSSVPFVLYSTALYTGMRAGELAGLRWGDVDLQRRSIHVRRSYAGQTKTRASRRHVPIVDALLPVLREWRLQCPPNEGDLVFPNRNGRMLEPCTRLFQEGFHRVLDDAGFKRPTEGRSRHVIHFHSLRHTFACHWRINGGSLDDLIRVMGHTSRSMTECYAHLGGYHRPEHFALFAPRPQSQRVTADLNRP